ncbi:MAG: hypothetical protein JO220_15680 [Hyphomicrobiales bacterium]|nr:hypothetical protein [Hyphomicrobiales bacterium]
MCGAAENDLAIVNNNANTMSGGDENAARKDRTSLRSLAKSGAAALQQEQWMRRPESMPKLSNNNPEQHPREPQRAAARGSRAIGERRQRLQIVADSALRAMPAGREDAAVHC